VLPSNFSPLQRSFSLEDLGSKTLTPAGSAS